MVLSFAESIEDSLIVLTQYSLLQRKVDTGRFSVHPIVHLWIRERLPRHVRSQLAQKALHVLHRTSKNNRKDRTRLIEHMDRILANVIVYRSNIINEIQVPTESRMLLAESRFSRILLSAYVVYLRTHALFEGFWIQAVRDRFPHLIEDCVFLLDFGDIYERSSDIYEHSGLVNRAELVYSFCSNQTAQRRSLLHPTTLRVLNGFGRQCYLKGNEIGAFRIYDFLLQARSRVLGHENDAITSALVELAKIGLRSMDPIINPDLDHSRLNKTLKEREDVLHPGYTISRDLFKHMMDIACNLWPSKDITSGEAFTIILRQLGRELDELTGLQGANSMQAKEAAADLARRQACFGSESAAEEMLKEMEPGTLSSTGLSYFFSVLIILARNARVRGNMERAFHFFSRFLATSRSLKLRVWSEVLLEYERLATSYRGENNSKEQVIDLFYEMIQNYHSWYCGYVAKERELSFVMHVFAALPTREGSLGEIFDRHGDYVLELLSVRTADDWFKNLLIMLRGMMQYLKKEIADASILLEQARRWMEKNDSDLEKKWPAHFRFFLGQINRFIGLALFESKRDEEAIAKMLEAYKSVEQAFEADVRFDDMNARFKIAGELLLFHVSPQDELALLGGTADDQGSLGAVVGAIAGGQTGHAINGKTSWVADLFLDMLHALPYEKLVEFEEMPIRIAAMIENLRVDHAQTCPLRRSVFDQFYCPT